MPLLGALMGRGASRRVVRRAVVDTWRAGGATAEAVARLRSDFGFEVPRRSVVAKEFAALQPLGIAVVGLLDPSYPPLLAAIPDPPLALFIQGDSAALLRPLMIAIVGSRRASPSGREFARALANDLGRAGFVIVSGLAAGIDGCAHRGALDGKAATVAVMGSGHAKVYPANHQGLAREVIAAGALVSEYPPSSIASQAHFPERNRIISGLAAGVVVVEATVRSGSLITARMALEQGREVLAVPGPVLNGTHGGCHRLLKQGAALVEDAVDVLDAFGIQATAVAEVELPSNPILARVLNSVTYSVAALQDIVELLAMPVDEVLGALVELELEGFVETYRDGYIRRPRKARDTR